MTDALPTQIGKYKIVELVGEGAMGTVYRATDSVLGRAVAIKVMNAEIARQKDHRQRFLREAQAAGSLQHPNVVTIYDLGELDGHLFIAMEFVHGRDLEKLMTGPEPLKLGEKLDIIVDVLMGLSYAHKHGIIHRDIKPANIRVGDDGHAKIMDFGVAHLASSDMTKTGLVVGTPSYMAPEQVTGGKSVPGTDLFAVGAVLYHLLTGSKPFEGPTLQSLFYRIVTDMPKPLDQVKPGLPAALNAVIQKAMAKEPEQRYASALDMANAIIAVRAELSGNAFASTVSLSHSGENAAVVPPPEVPTLTASSTRLPWKPVAAAAAGIAVLLIGWMAVKGSDKPSQVAVNASADSAAIAAPVVESSMAAPPATTAQPDTQPLPPPPAAVEKKTTPEPSPAPAQKKRETPVRVREEQKKAQKPAPKPVAPSRTTTTSTQTQPVQQQTRTVPTPQVVAPPVTEAPQQRIVVAPPPPPPPPPVRTPDPEPRPAPREEIASTVQAYARAIESRDIGAVRRVYPGISSDQARGFEQFFQSARNINVTFNVSNVETNGNTAEARLSGTYQYTTSDGKAERQPVSFSASLRYDGSSWRLTSVR
ncbi:MAG TPA: protein kinase [Gemmatimonadaceae bacterium]